MHGYSPDGTLDGYVEFSLSTFKTSDLDNKTMEMWTRNETFYNTCHYTGHYNPPDAEDAYEFSPAFWHINFFRKKSLSLLTNLSPKSQVPSRNSQ